MNIVYLGLGSNLNNPQRQVTTALKELARLPNTEILQTSSLYKSLALTRGQANFINAVAKLATTLSPLQLLKLCQKIELDHGRTRTIRWESRTLDIDILLFNDWQLIKTDLTIPHPSLTERDFVLYPLLEIEPELKLPNGIPIKDFLLNCPNNELAKITEVEPT